MHCCCCVLRVCVWSVCVILFQEVEPRVGEKLCRLWATVDERQFDSGPRLHSLPLRDHASHHHQQHHTHHHSSSSTSTFAPLLPPAFPPPFAPQPHMAAMFPDGRPPQIHMNPALYPPPRLGPHPQFYWGGRPPRNFHGPSKRYSEQHRARGRTATLPRDSPPLPPT